MRAPALIIAGIIYGPDIVPGQITAALEKKWGKIVVQGKSYPFDSTDYYGAEMGGDLQRCWYVFSNLVDESELASCKIFAMDLEEDYTETGNRRINLDPGYLTGAKLVLASHKNFAHRVCLQEGIFAELTLRFHKGRWKTLPWTYPDLVDFSRHKWLDKGRELWLRKQKDLTGNP